MRSFSLHLQLSCLVVLMAINAAGCHTMGGYAANSSGMSYYEEGNYTAAAGEFQQAMQANPSNPDYVANFAKARMKLGDTQGAEQLYRQALAIAPSHQPAYHGLAETMMTAGRGEEAASLLTTWAATQPYVPESHIELAWIQREMGQIDASAQSLQRALRLNPAHATALAQLGQYYDESGHPDQAVAAYQQSLQADWNQPEVHSRIAAASQSAGVASPMAATAMARGVHPHNIPRQQTAFGQPSRGAQLAQMRMAQTQMAMSGNPMYGLTSPSYGSQMASAPGMNQGTMSAYYAPDNVQSFGTGAMQGQWQVENSMMNLPADQTASMSFGTNSFGTNSFETESFESGMPGVQPSEGEWSFEGAAPTDPAFNLPHNSTPNTAVAPTPDPAFSATEPSTRVSRASWSASELKKPMAETSAGNSPLVEAF
ncbi:MAG: tetratricopeptide repeat protein [Planctomycetota bacterium]|nr:tetratricopeptide repeat protein [Planctomycetota bacterium]